MRRSRRGPDREFVAGGRRWIRTSGLLHVKHFRLSAVLRAWDAEQNRLSYAVTVMPDADASKELSARPLMQSPEVEQLLRGVIDATALHRQEPRAA